MLRYAQVAAPQKTSIATVLGRVLFAAIALLVITVGALATESNLPRTNQRTNSWHTTKSSFKAECGGDLWVSPQVDESDPSTPVVVQTPRQSLLSFEQPPLETTGAIQAHGLRAPPRV